MKGTLVYVLRSALGDSTNGGLTSKFKSLILCGPGIPESNAPSSQFPGLRLVKEREGTVFENVYAEPLPELWPPGHIGPMAGGNYIVLETRVPGPLGGRMIEKIIRVHDRFETQEHYDILSR